MLRMFVFLAALTVILFGLAPKAQAGNGVVFAVNDGNFLNNWSTMGQEIASLRNIQVGVWVSWKCDLPSQPEPVWQVPENQPTLLQVLGDPWSCSSRLTTPQMRDNYCRFVQHLVLEHPGVREVQIWNEIDLAFWQASLDDYIRLQARCYDLLHKYVLVLGGGFSPNALNLYDPAVKKITIYDYATAVEIYYAVTGRKRPLMDGLAYHPYWGWSQKITSEIAKNLNWLWLGLPQPSPKQGLRFWWTETGSWSVPGPWPPFLKMGGTPEHQGHRTKAVLKRAVCDPNVAFVANFLLGDEPDRQEGQGYPWKSGLLYEDGTPKPAFFAFKGLNDERLAGSIVCHHHGLRRAILDRLQRG